MKRIALSFATVAVLVTCTSSAQASDLTEILRIAFGSNNRPYQRAAQQAHVDHHVDLQAREIEREYVHQAAHYQPLTTGQHIRLHNDLDAVAFYDAVEHDTAHATGAYYPRVNYRQAYQPRGYAPRVLPPQYTQGYRGVTNGYGVPYGGYQYQPSPYESRVGCSPYGRY